MRKTYSIFYREINHILSYFPEENIKKYYKLGIKNEFFTQAEAENFLLNPDNSSKFDENFNYFILPIFSKE